MFSGIGGFELGIQRASDHRPFIPRKEGKAVRQSESCVEEWKNRPYSWECIGFSEIDKYAIATYLKHWPGHRNYGDATRIRTEDLPDFDFLCAGFPCQSFSIAGKRRGFEDTRGTMFFEIARILRDKKPGLILLENVKGLLNHDEGKTFRVIIQTLDELGYDAEWMVLNSKHFGVPQNRERVFIVGYIRGQPRHKIFPLREPEGKTYSCIKTISQSNISPTIDTGVGSLGYYEPYVVVHNMQPRSENRPSMTRACDCGSGKLYKDCCGCSSGTGHIQKEEETYCLDTANSMAIEIPSIGNIRRLTPIECERLQGFPDNWTIGSDCQRYKQCGNAVTVNVIQAIMEKFIEWQTNRT